MLSWRNKNIYVAASLNWSFDICIFSILSAKKFPADYNCAANNLRQGDKVVAFPFNVSMIHVLKFRTPKFLTKWHMQTLQTEVIRSSLIRVYTVCHSYKYFETQLHKIQNFGQKSKE